MAHQFGSFFPVQLDILFELFLGLACRPTDMIYAQVVGRSFRGTPILAVGIGVARFCVLGLLCFCFGLWAIFMSVCFAFHATGLDAVQRLEPKKTNEK